MQGCGHSRFDGQMVCHRVKMPFSAVFVAISQLGGSASLIRCPKLGRRMFAAAHGHRALTTPPPHLRPIGVDALTDHCHYAPFMLGS